MLPHSIKGEKKRYGLMDYYCRWIGLNAITQMKRGKSDVPWSAGKLV